MIHKYAPGKEPIFKVFSGVFFSAFCRLMYSIINSIEKKDLRKVKIDSLVLRVWYRLGDNGFYERK